MRLTRKPALPAPLVASPLGQTISHDELRRLDQIGTIVRVPEGKQIIADHAVGRECFVVLDGEFAIESTIAQGTLGAGEVAGELALMTGRPRNASVSASSDAAVYAFNRREFAALFDAAPQLRTRIVAGAIDRLRPRGQALPDRYLAAVGQGSHDVVVGATGAGGPAPRRWRGRPR